MPSTSIETMVLFIAGIVVAGAVAGTLTTEVQRLSSAIDDQGIDMSQEVRTDIEIISDPSAPEQIYDGTNITLLVKNSGSEKLEADNSSVDVLVDGEYDSDVFIDEVVDSDSDTWDTNNVVRMNVTESGLASGDHRVKVIVNGDEEVFEFRT